MAATETTLPSTRTRADPYGTAILNRRDGIFAGLVLLIVGGVWFLNTAEVINLGPKFAELIVPFLLILAGLYLLLVKLVRA